MNLFEAKLKLASLMVKINKFKNAWVGPIHGDSVSDEGDTEDRNEDFYKEFDSLKGNLVTLGEELASYPHIRPHMECWVINVRGSGSLSETELQSLLKGDDISTVINSMTMLANKVKYELETNSWHITNVNMAGDGWRLKISCTEEESNKLCDFLHEKYFTEITAQIIKVSKTFDGFKFKDIKNIDEAESFLNKSAN